MHVWEVVLAQPEINDLNMCYSGESSKLKCRQKHWWPTEGVGSEEGEGESADGKPGKIL